MHGPQGAQAGQGRRMETEGRRRGLGLPPGAGRGQGRFALAESRGASGCIVPVQRAARCYGWLVLPCGAGYKAENAHCLWCLCQLMGQTSLLLEMNTLVLWNTRSSVPEPWTGRETSAPPWLGLCRSGVYPGLLYPVATLR